MRGNTTGAHAPDESTTYPGQQELTMMPRGSNSFAVTRIAMLNSSFDTPYLRAYVGVRMCVPARVEVHVRATMCMFAMLNIQHLVRSLSTALAWHSLVRQEAGDKFHAWKPHECFL